MTFKYYFWHEWTFLMLVLWSRILADRPYGNYLNPHLTIFKSGFIILGFDHTSVSSTCRLRYSSLVDHQALLPLHSLNAINLHRHIMGGTSVVKQPYVVTVLAASARLNHWWGYNPFKCWSHIYARPDICHDCCWCFSKSGSHVTSKPKNDFIIPYVPPVLSTIDAFD